MLFLLLIKMKTDEKVGSGDGGGSGRAIKSRNLKSLTLLRRYITRDEASLSLKPEVGPTSKDQFDYNFFSETSSILYGGAGTGLV
jgi:hypothetical protein